MTATTNERVNVHVQLSVRDVQALDLLSAVKTEIGPARWSRAACIREAIREYVTARQVTGEPGSFRILEPGDGDQACAPPMEGLVCELCGEPVSLEPTWRTGHDGWEHRCRDLIPQAGHPGRAVPTRG